MTNYANLFSFKSTVLGVTGNHGECAQKPAMVEASCDPEVSLNLRCMVERSAQDHLPFCKHATLMPALKVQDRIYCKTSEITEWDYLLYQNVLFFSVDCIWAAWSAWGTCDSGSGVQDRNRTVDQEALNGGTDCAGNTTETQDCPGRSVFVIDSIIPYLCLN